MYILRTMLFKLIILCLLIILLSSAESAAIAEPRSPRIYNVLITSKKNLSPSHAEPVYEPVLRTTSIGYAYPSSFFYHIQGIPGSFINTNGAYRGELESPLINHNGQLLTPLQSTVGNNNVEPDKSFKKTDSSSSSGEITYSGEINNNNNNNNGPYALNFRKYLPKNEDDSSGERNSLPTFLPEETDPKKIIANLKRNPNIPDVPPPPLPVRLLKS